jgi:hypothetical protein
MRRASALPATLALTLATSANAQVEVRQAAPDAISIAINGQPYSTFYLGGSNPKPFLAPLKTASGIIVSRRWPMETVPGESRDHPHHRGLWIGYGDVDGINFWENDPQSKPSPENPQTKGSLALKSLDALESGKVGSVVASFDWTSPAGPVILHERRTLTFYSSPAPLRIIDIETVLTAPHDVKIGDTKEGFFAIRVADSMAGKNGGLLRNSNGATGEKQVWGRRADWVDYSGKVEGQTVGIAIFDNPHNWNHPPRWHARDYGLFAVNPFGVHDFDHESTEEGGRLLSQGDHLTFRYRVIIHSGEPSPAEVAKWYSEYTRGTRQPSSR